MEEQSKLEKVKKIMPKGRCEGAKWLEELRCSCGNLMAAITEEGIELKCRRCKRRRLMPLKEIAEDVRIKWSKVLRVVA